MRSKCTQSAAERPLGFPLRGQWCLVGTGDAQEASLVGHMVNRHESLTDGCTRWPTSGVYRIHSEPKSGSSWFSRVLVSLLQSSCVHMQSMGCRVLHHEEDARQEPEIVLVRMVCAWNRLTCTLSPFNPGRCLDNPCPSSSPYLSTAIWYLLPDVSNALAQL